MLLQAELLEIAPKALKEMKRRSCQSCSSRIAFDKSILYSLGEITRSRRRAATKFAGTPWKLKRKILLSIN